MKDKCIQIIEVSDAVYDKIMARRVGRESISKTIERELRPAEDEEAGWDVDKLDADLNKTLKTSKLIPFDEAFKDV